MYTSRQAEPRPPGRNGPRGGQLRRDLATGISLEKLAAQTAGLDADQLEAQIAQREVELETLERQKDELANEAGRERAELARMDGSDLAAVKEEETQLLLAQIRAGAERYVRLRLAAVILQRAVERYREKNQGDVLRQGAPAGPRPCPSSMPASWP
jgi:uncharacterized protein YhaN